MSVGHSGASTELQDGVGGQVEVGGGGENGGAGAQSLSLSGRDGRGPDSVCCHRAASFSLSYSLSLITHFLVQTVCRPGISLESQAAHDAAVISVDTGSISFTASSITSIT